MAYEPPGTAITGATDTGSAQPSQPRNRLIEQAALMIAIGHTLQRQTRGHNHIIDLTDELQALVRQSGITCGQLTAMVTGSTGALSTLEYEPGLVGHDIAAALEKIAPHDGPYAHEETWHDDNGHSHVRACLIGPSLALPIVDGSLPLGTWQQIVLLDFDTRPRSRRIAVTLLGSGSAEQP